MRSSRTRLPRYSCRIIVLHVAILHLLWAVFLLADAGPRLTTPIAGLASVVPSHIALSAVFLLAAVLAIGNGFIVLPIFRVALLLPQQALILASAVAALTAAWHGQYPDGVMRSSLFILADQLPIIALAAIHSLAILSEGSTKRWTHISFP